MAFRPDDGRRRRPRKGKDGGAKDEKARRGSGKSGAPRGGVRTSAGVQTRLAAADLIFRVMDEGADLETAFEASESFDALTGPDRGFARAIASAALRGLGRIDYALGTMLDRPLADIEPPVRALLRAGAAQLWTMGVADHAAVSSTVEAARAWREASKGGGLINAVLRRAAREPEAFAAAPLTAIWPDWLAARMKSALGPGRADALALLQLEDPPIDLTLKSGEDVADWTMKLGGEALPSGSIRLPSGASLTELPGYADGAWWVQDAAAAIPARLLGDLRGKAVVDLCAAPGGKALQLASQGADLTAIDISAQRLMLVRENAERTHLPMRIVEADARSWKPDAAVDAVLLDAPCSALGTLRRHPEGAWRRDPQGLARYPAIQATLVEAARGMLKPGGQLIYCVCTPLREEGAEIVAQALATGDWLRRPVTPGELPGLAHALTDEGDVMSAPPANVGDSLSRVENVSEQRESDSWPVMSDVFYIARLERA
jgi:16S rRNA (cytosine967-C5)-methyltransferase